MTWPTLLVTRLKDLQVIYDCIMAWLQLTIPWTSKQRPTSRTHIDSHAAVATRVLQGHVESGLAQVGSIGIGKTNVPSMNQAAYRNALSGGFNTTMRHSS